MLSYNEQFQIALELAVEKHKNQTDNDNPDDVEMVTLDGGI